MNRNTEISQEMDRVIATRSELVRRVQEQRVLIISLRESETKAQGQLTDFSRRSQNLTIPNLVIAKSSGTMREQKIKVQIENPVGGSEQVHKVVFSSSEYEEKGPEIKRVKTWREFLSKNFTTLYVDGNNTTDGLVVNISVESVGFTKVVTTCRTPHILVLFSDVRISGVIHEDLLIGFFRAQITNIQAEIKQAEANIKSIESSIINADDRIVMLKIENKENTISLSNITAGFEKIKSQSMESIGKDLTTCQSISDAIIEILSDGKVGLSEQVGQILVETRVGVESLRDINNTRISFGVVSDLIKMVVIELTTLLKEITELTI